MLEKLLGKVRWQSDSGARARVELSPLVDYKTPGVAFPPTIGRSSARPLRRAFRSYGAELLGRLKCLYW
jgi:hypothetical protein